MLPEKQERRMSSVRKGRCPGRDQGRIKGLFRKQRRWKLSSFRKKIGSKDKGSLYLERKEKRSSRMKC